MGRRVVQGVAMVGAVAGGLLLFLVVSHGTTAVYDLPLAAVAVGVVASVATIAGWWLIARSGDAVAVAAAAVGFLAVGGFVSLLSIGIFVLAAAAVCGLALSRRLATLEGDRRRALRPALWGAVVVAVGLPVAGIVAGSGPLVRCHDDGGVSTTDGLIRSLGASSFSSSGTTSVDGVTEGSITIGRRRYVYRCVGGNLAEFRADAGPL